MPKPKYAAYETAGPYFDLVRGALGDLAVTSDAFAEAFGLLCFLHVLLFLATLRLPWLVPDAAENGFVREQPIPD